MTNDTLKNERKQLRDRIAEKQELLADLEKKKSASAKNLAEQLEQEIRNAQGQLEAVELIISAEATGKKIHEVVDSTSAFLGRIGKYLGQNFEELLDEIKKKTDEGKKKK